MYITTTQSVPIAAITAQPSVIQNKKFYSWKLYPVEETRDVPDLIYPTVDM